MNTDKKGALAERLFDAEALKRGLTVSVPISEAVYDRILERQDGSLVRVQIKYADNDGPSHSGGAVTVGLEGSRNGKTSRRAYTDEDVDAVVVYLPQTDRLYWLPPEVFVGKRGVALRLFPPRNNQRANVNMAEDFEW